MKIDRNLISDLVITALKIFNFNWLLRGKAGETNALPDDARVLKERERDGRSLAVTL